jgi:hypothetical protein
MASAAGVIQMNVGKNNIVDILNRQILFLKNTDNARDRESRTGVDQRHFSIFDNKMNGSTFGSVKLRVNCADAIGIISNEWECHELNNGFDLVWMGQLVCFN